MTMKIWSVKIGEIDAEELQACHPHADTPMRKAVQQEYLRVTGRDPDFTFSGWGAELDEHERAVVENREPIQETGFLAWMNEEITTTRWGWLAAAFTILAVWNLAEYLW